MGMLMLNIDHTPIFLKRCHDFVLRKFNVYCSDTTVDFNSVLACALNGIVSHTFARKSCFTDAFIDFYFVVLTVS